MNKVIYDALAKLSPNNARPFDLRADGDIEDKLSNASRGTFSVLSGVSGKATPRDEEPGNVKRR
ncbi:hypothetical protein ABVF61_07915 [Roseibium sp. HPY-6]|uniref:hypothetical protein n=1 Tax=Roseibium sp. HPY-6 TaxID=3229852 RepID=UPI00338E95B2